MSTLFIFYNPFKSTLINIIYFVPRSLGNDFFVRINLGKVSGKITPNYRKRRFLFLGNSFWSTGKIFKKRAHLFLMCVLSLRKGRRVITHA